MNTSKKAFLKEYFKGITSLVFSPNGKYLASGSFDGIKIWDIDTPKEVVLEGLTKGIIPLAFSPNGKFFAGLSFDGIKIWDIDTPKEVVLEEYFKGITSLAFNPDGKYLASGSLDKKIKIWNIDPKSKAFGKCQHTLILEINCEEMKIRGAKGLNKEEISFLEARGAII